MITKIAIHNFQCHKDLVLDFGRSTVLQGNSNCGKTAVFRALYWVLFNKAPSDFVSYWVQKRNKKGFTFKDNEYTSVCVSVDGHSIERKRSNDFNGYIVDGKVYEALRTDVPEEVTKIFNLSDASIQRQMDAPFLLSATPGEASQYLNDLAGLTCVDDILSIAKSKVADTSESISDATEKVQQLEKDKQQYAWVPDAEDLLKRVQKLQTSIEEMSRKLEALSSSITDYKSIRNYPEIPEWLENGDRSALIEDTESRLEIVKKYVSACKVLDRVSPVLAKLSGLAVPEQPRHSEKELSGLVHSVREYNSVCKSVDSLKGVLNNLSGLKEPKPCKWVDTLPVFKESVERYTRLCATDSKVSGALSKLSKLKEPTTCKWSDKEHSTLIRSIRSYRSLVNTIADCKDYLDDAYDSLKDAVCPVCGRPFDVDTCFM